MRVVVTFEDFLKTYPEGTVERVKLYNKVMYLRKTFGYGSKRIAKILGISRYKLESWVYGGKTPEPLIAISRLNKLGFTVPLKIVKTPEFELFVKLLAFTFGDGGISSQFQSYYTGYKEDLLKLKSEAEETLKLPCKIHEINHNNNFIAVRRVKGTSYSLVIQGQGNHFLGRLLHSAGAPVGDKVVKSYTIPNWIMKGPKWVKKLFIEVLLGNELTTPRLDKSRKISFSSIPFMQVKIEARVDSLRRFLNQLRKLLEEFGVKTSPVKEGTSRRDRRKDNSLSSQLRFYIRKEITNVIKFYQTFQLRYASRKQRLLKEAIEKAVKNLEEELIKINLYFKALKLSKRGLGSRRISRLLGVYPKHKMIEGWLNASQKPEYFNKRKEIERILDKFT